MRNTVKRFAHANDVNVAELIKQYEAVWRKLDKFNQELSSVAGMLINPRQQEACKKMLKQYDELTSAMTSFYEALQDARPATKAVEKMIFELPFEGENFKTAWQNWKDYLTEQFGIELSTRAELKQLMFLKQYSDDNETKAIEILDYAESRLYVMFFRLDEAKNSKKAGPKRADEGDY